SPPLLDPELSANLQRNQTSKLVNALWATLTPAPTPQSASVCPMAIPPSYAGDTAECGGFLLQVALFIEMQPQKFFLISLLSSRALMWVKAIWNANSLIINSYEVFTNHFKEVFGSTTDVLSVSDQLLQLRQGASPIHDYALQFRTLAPSSGWNEAALLSAYRQGLDSRLHAQMAIYDDNVGLENFMLRANRIAQRLSACHTHEAAHQSAAPAASPPVPEPMQMDSTRLTPSERARRLASGLCLYCTATDHYIGTCPVRPPRPAVSTLQFEPEIATLSMLSVQLLTPDHSFTVPAFVDSGSSGNFNSQDLLKCLHLPCTRQARELKVETIQGKPLGRGRVKFRAPSLRLKIGNLHEKEITFLVLEGPTVDIILGRPWLILHSPEIRWDSCKVTRWSEFCHQHCISALPKPSQTPRTALIASTRIKSPESLETPTVLSDYVAFQDVFSKQAATHLPPHRPWDCAIDLLPGAKLPKGRVYPLSIPERKAMEEYIQEALSQGFIRPSTSPAASSFFFVGKKDGGLRPCIDYRLLNSQTVKHPYPLPLPQLAPDHAHLSSDSPHLSSAPHGYAVFVQIKT
uniref:Retrotransposon gag domain-containing protein n=1 Tax=Sinocyclocheilus anshuiensis TaxID=1608454 RepID=A0A671RHV1_9TELE